MHSWFISKVTYEKTFENGIQKKVTEPYLIDALSWTEAEARTIEELKPFISGDFTITDIRPAKLSEIFFFADGDRYFKAKIQFITLDEKKGVEKKTNVYMLAQAGNIDQAQEVIKKGMEGTLAAYVIAEVKETPIMDVFPYKEQHKKYITI